MAPTTSCDLFTTAAEVSNLELESNNLSSTFMQLHCGVDEAGRGPLAGRVYAAAVILDPLQSIPGLADSKQLSRNKREELYQKITVKALAYAISSASVDEIDKLNILNATLLAMQRAVASLPVTPGLAMIDGNKAPQLAIPVATIIKGDALVPAISAASILAKVTRDREMIELDKIYPEYGFAKHKGYGTREHLDALAKHGPLTIHRTSFAPVKLYTK